MDLLRYLIEGRVDFIIASTPLVIVLLQLKVFKHSIKGTVICLSLNLLVSIYFWVNLRNLNLALYQVVPYVLSYILLVCESILKNKKE